jgi:capsid protein
MYSEMRSKLVEVGETASFEREFSGVVGYLTRDLFQTFLKDTITSGKEK